ncbi:signal peptidase I [Lysinibacter cavernae]|uniref:Signal peptidase I n=1 Tax=Lysinibacter cavernae TaxID=1640652 RepID=A0A7X5R0C1_9MICO|nr:signal peptidase I [Lysinibacter cavernae]NIH53281.1 signal peptidase [Lysinibacter cavernae]
MAAHAANRRSRTAWDITKAIAFGVVVSALIVIVAALIVVPRATGSTTYTILTNSMAPGLPPGTVIVTQPRAISDIRVGDVITYQVESGKPAVITHRVVGISTDTRGETAFITRGDNNSVNDPEPIIREQVLGVVIYSVPYIGLAINAVTGNAKLLVPVLIAVVFILWGLGYVVSYVLSRKKKQAALPEDDAA